MANLIITIIAIALVAVAALMGAYYGGTAFNQGQEKAKASSIMNQAAQIQAGVQIAKIDSTITFATGSDQMSVLTTNDALSSVPALDGEAWTLTTDGTDFTATLTSGSITADVCTELEKQVGTGGAWTCVSAEGSEAVTYQF